MKSLISNVKVGISACLVAVVSISSPANATKQIDPAPVPVPVPVACKNTDISPTAMDCRGFVFGNPVSNNPDFAIQSQTLLAQLGYFGAVSPGIETLENLNGEDTIDFATLLFGETIIGVHYGNGKDSPGAAAKDGDDTAFYKFNAGLTGLDTFTLNYGASSNVRLYKTGVGAVPEPATWMFMLLGMAGIGFSMRRKGKQALQVRYT